MAFPQVATTNNSTDLTTDTNHTISLPSGIEAGDLLIIVFTGSATDTTPNSAISGWQLLRDMVFSSSTGHCAVFYRIADGGEGATVVATTDLSEDNAAVSYRITDWHGTTPPEVSAEAEGTSTASDPPTLSPSWGAEDTLWIAIAGIDTTGGDVSAYPANYSSNQVEARTATSLGGCAAMATRELNDDAEDPGAFTNNNGRWCACTVAVRPAAGGGGGGLTIPIAMHHYKQMMGVN